MPTNDNRLIGSKELLAEIFSDSCRPSERWLARMRASGRVPFVKLGGKILFNPDRVRVAFERLTVGGGLN